MQKHRYHGDVNCNSLSAHLTSLSALYYHFKFERIKTSLEYKLWTLF